MSVVDLGARLRVVRTPEQVEQHRAEVLKSKRAAAARVNGSKQRAKRLQRTVRWADDAAIAAFYREAARLTRVTGVQHDVDHIIPLQGRNVSGLHVQNNLQVLPRKVNRQKWNLYDGEPDACATEPR